MARLPDHHGYKTYAQEGGGDQLRWWCNEGIGAGVQDVVTYKEIIREDWEPYHIIKRIQPENAEEVWINSDGHVMIIGEKDGGLWCYFSEGMSCPLEKGHYVFHGEGVWERIHPQVEEKK